MRGMWVGLLLLLLAAIFSEPGYAQRPFNGKSQYVDNCASCHGISGKGDGPVAKVLSQPPTDLTKLSDANNGVFPSERLYEVIDGRREMWAHGTRDMPVWGLAARVSPSLSRARIRAVVDYLSTLQAK
jgi:mono/diheme cytochrome c family protein